MFDLRYYSISKEFKGQEKTFITLEEKDIFVAESDMYYVIGCANEVGDILLPIAVGDEILQNDEAETMSIIKKMAREKAQAYIEKYAANLKAIIFPSKWQIQEIIKSHSNDIIEINDEQIKSNNEFIVMSTYIKTTDNKVVMIADIGKNE